MNIQLENVDESIKAPAKKTARPVRIIGAAFGDPMAENRRYTAGRAQE